MITKRFLRFAVGPSYLEVNYEIKDKKTFELEPARIRADLLLKSQNEILKVFKNSHPGERNDTKSGNLKEKWDDSKWFFMLTNNFLFSTYITRFKFGKSVSSLLNIDFGSKILTTFLQIGKFKIKPPNSILSVFSPILCSLFNDSLDMMLLDLRAIRPSTSGLYSFSTWLLRNVVVEIIKYPCHTFTVLGILGIEVNPFSKDFIVPSNLVIMGIYVSLVSFFKHTVKDITSYIIYNSVSSSAKKKIDNMALPGKVYEYSSLLQIVAPATVNCIEQSYGDLIANIITSPFELYLWKAIVFNFQGSFNDNLSISRILDLETDWQSFFGVTALEIGFYIAQMNFVSFPLKE